MWIIAKTGFVSLVQHNTNPDMIRARSRTREHMEATFPGIDIEDLGVNAPDYRFHADVPRALAANVIAQTVMAVDYESHVKESVTTPPGGTYKDRDQKFYSAMMRCWTALATLQERGQRDPDWWDKGGQTGNYEASGYGYGTLWDSLRRDNVTECQNCEARVEGDWMFCPECGEELGEDDDDELDDEDGFDGTLEDRDRLYAEADRRLGRIHIDPRPRIDPHPGGGRVGPSEIGGLADSIAGRMTAAADKTMPEWETTSDGYLIVDGIDEYLVKDDGHLWVATRNGVIPKTFAYRTEAQRFVGDVILGKRRWGA